MGWFGYGIYDGDGTQTCHYAFIKNAGIKVNIDEWLGLKGTKIPAEHLSTFIKGIPKILKKMPKVKVYWTDDKAMEWQMLLALLKDNGLYHKEIYDRGIEATKYLMGEHASDFNNVSARRQVLKNFIKKCEVVEKYELGMD
jgi:hypothetical protein